MKGGIRSKILAQMASLLSVVNGGIIGALKKMKRFDDRLELRIYLPGIKAESIKAEIKDNYLTVMYFIETTTEKMQMKIANVVHSQDLPYFVDIRRIRAHFANGELDITMPFNELARGFNKKLDIAK